MKTVKMLEPRKVEVIKKDIPVREKGTALLEILYGGICGSDLGTYRGNLPYVSYPRIPGHEFSARVVEADENEYGIKSGMIVTANPYFNKSQIFSAASPAVPVFLISNFAYLR